MSSFIIFNLLSFLIFLSLLIFHEKISYKIKLIDYPDNNRKKHKKPTPVSGGLIVFFSSIPLIIYYFNIYFQLDKYLVIFLVVYSTFFFTGLYDDVYDIKPMVKLNTSIILILFLLLFNSELTINYLRFDINNLTFFIGHNTSIFFLIFCFLLLQNSLNMTDGINGLFIIIVINILFTISSYQNTIILPFIYSLIFFLIILFVLNMKSKLFLGDSGVFIFSLIIFVLTLDTYKSNPNFKCDQIFLMLMIPGVDMLRLFIFRIIKGDSPFLPSLNHFHHKLSAKFGFKSGLLIYSAIVFIPNYLSTKFFEAYILVLISIILYLFLMIICKNAKYT